MTTEDFFPPCSASTCPEMGRHKHILPHQRELLESPAKYVWMSGGYGSAKTLPACVLGVMLSLTVPGNRGFVGRRTYAKLHDSTQATMFEIMERIGLLEHCVLRENRDGWHHRVILPNSSEIIFRETKDIGRFLGPQYGWFLLDEVTEEPESTFTKLMGRLRLPRAGAYLKGILLSNPPDRRHWLPRWFGEQPGMRKIEDPTTGFVTTFHHIRSATTQNPHLPPGYVESLRLLNPNEYRKVVTGELGFTADGPPVYPEFAHNVHVGIPELRPGSPLRRGWDFGFRHPAVVWGDVFACKRGVIHTVILHELDIEQVEAEELARRVIEETTRRWPRVPARMIQDAGDAAGAAVSDKGPGAIIRLARPPFNLRFRFQRISNIDPGLDLIRKLLRAGVCPCGLPVFHVHRGCRNVIDAFAGGYHYPTKNRDKPVKDGHYDDFADATRYFVWNFVRPELSGGVISTIERVNEDVAPSPAWAWMDPPPGADEVALEIERVKEAMRR